MEPRTNVFPRSSRPGQRTPTLGRYVHNRWQVSDGLPYGVPGSHMPLDTRLGWRWNNLLNVIPLLIIVALALALVALIV